jgi:hypothetical protein
MKYILSTLWFVLILSSTCLAGDDPVTEEVCLKMTGCRINIDTGECPECVIGKREVIHTHEVKEKPVVKTTPKKKSTGKRKWRCIVEPCDWIDENGNLKS